MLMIAEKLNIMELPIVILLIAAFASSSALREFPSRTSEKSDCPGAAKECWCKDSFAQCWGPYDEAGIGNARNSISMMELKHLNNKEVLTYVEEMPSLSSLKFGHGNHLDCTCEVIDALVARNVTIVRYGGATINNCRDHGFARDSMSPMAQAGRCFFQRIAREIREDHQVGKSLSIGELMKRASARKGAEPAGYKHAPEGDKQNPGLFNFFLGQRQNERSADMTGVAGLAQKAHRVRRQAMRQAMRQPDLESVAETEESAIEDEGETINEEVMEKIKAVLGATKIDLPVDINDPYDLGLLLRHLRHHSHLLANIDRPEVREQVLAAMQEEAEDEEADAVIGARNGVINNAQHQPWGGAMGEQAGGDIGGTGVAHGGAAGGMGVARGGAAGGMGVAHGRAAGGIGQAAGARGGGYAGAAGAPYPARRVPYNNAGMPGPQAQNNYAQQQGPQMGDYQRYPAQG